MGVVIEVFEGPGAENVTRKGQKWVKCPRVPRGATWKTSYCRLEPEDFKEVTR